MDIQQLLNSSEIYLSGKSDKVKLALCAILSNGHALIEDVPGVGKTTLVKILGKILNQDVNRIQFTNDILPSDIIGTSIFNRDTHQFEFRHGPIFGEIILADELNRAPAKTQSALLQSMEERNVTVDGKTYELPATFTVFATQNPNAQIGTFDLPESQLDRFCIKFNLGYPDKENSIKMLKTNSIINDMKDIKSELSSKDLLDIQNKITLIKFDESLFNYIYDLLDYSRKDSKFIPLSNRCGIDLVKTAKTIAFMNKRDYVIPDDIQFIFPYVAGHRLVHPSQSSIEKEHIMASEILASIPLR
jgi:MoxR-like ATPase